MTSVPLESPPRDALAAPLLPGRLTYGGLLGLLLLFAIGAVVVHLRGLDPLLFGQAQALTRLLPDGLWAALSVLGLGLGVAIVAALAAGRYPLPAAGMAWALVLGGLGVHVVKRLWPMPRPAALLPPDAVHVVGQKLMAGSMPSGHSTAALGLAALLICTLPGGRRWAVPLLIVGALTAMARIGVGAHWPADVLAGSAVGVSSALVAVALEARFSFARWLATRRGQRWLAAVQVAMGIAMVTTHTGYPSAWLFQYALAAASVAGGVWRWHRHAPGWPWA